MEHSTESRLENLLWVALQAISVANRESIGTKHHKRICELREHLSNDWDFLRELTKPVISKSENQ